MQKIFWGQSLLSLPVSIRMKGVQLVGFSWTYPALGGDGGRRRHMNYSLNFSRLSRLDGGVGLLSSRVVIIRLMQGTFVGFLRGSCLRSEEGYLTSEGSPQFIQGTIFRGFPSAL